MEANSSDETQGLPTPRLRCMSPADAESIFTPLRLVLQPGGRVIDLLKPEMIAGRHSDADLRIALPDVSRRHCRFVFDGGFWRICDLQSLNGTFVNGRRIDEVTLGHGDQIRVGPLTFAVDLETNQALDEPGAQVIRSIMDVLPAPTRKAS